MSAPKLHSNAAEPSDDVQGRTSVALLKNNSE
jgi:hypothetical protein